MISARACFKDSFDISMSAMMGAGFGFVSVCGLAVIIVSKRSTRARNSSFSLRRMENCVSAANANSSMASAAARRHSPCRNAFWLAVLAAF